MSAPLEARVGRLLPSKASANIKFMYRLNGKGQSTKMVDLDPKVEEMAHSQV